MRIFKYFIYGLILILFPLCGWGQNVEQQLENYLELTDNSEAGEELQEELARLSESPINLNDTNSQIPDWLLTPMQQELLKFYISQHGPLMTWDEMEMVNGLDSLTIVRIRPYTELTEVKKHRTRLKTMFRNGNHNFIIGSSLSPGLKQEYEDEGYEGRAYRLYTRYRFHYKDNLSIQFSADKDAGEAFFYGSQKRGFDWYSGHIMLKNIGHLKSAVIGHYRLQFGQGLTLWTGYSPFDGVNAASRRYGRGVCAASPFAENDYLQGAATTISIAKGVELTGFYSFANRDATIDTSLGIARTIYKTGYHRSANEIARRHTLGEHLYGGNLQWNWSHLHIGVTGVRTLFTMDLQPTPTKYNYYYFQGNSNTNAGIDAAWRTKHIIVYGEGAWSQGGGWAALVGSDIYATSRTTLSILYRYYSEDYHNFHADAWSHSSQLMNENGLRLAVQSQLPHGFILTLQGDIYRHPYLRYGCYSPSQGEDIRFSIQKTLSKKRADREAPYIAVRYRFHDYMKNVSGGSEKAYEVKGFNQHTAYADFQCSSAHCQFRTRAGYTAILNEQGISDQGVVLLQDCTAQWRKFTFAGRLAAFDMTSYNARLYAMERDFIYEFAAPAFYNKGLRCYFMVRYAITDKLSIGAKYAITHYAHDNNNSIGNSNKQTVKLQLHWAAGPSRRNRHQNWE